MRMKRAALGLALIFAINCGGSSSGGGSGSGGSVSGGTAGVTGGTGGLTGGTAGVTGGTAGVTGGTAGNTGGTAGTAGNTGGTAGATSDSGAGTGGTGAVGGGGGQCANLVAQYASTITAAKQCPLDSNEPTCTQSVDWNIDGCGYYVFVDASNTNELKQLESIKNDWKKLSCDPMTTCALGGFPPIAASCQANGQGGTLGVCVENNK
jgi:hypothetical protein